MTGRRAALDRLRHWPVSAAKGRLIYDEGESPQAFYRVESGCVRLQLNGEHGNRQILAFCLPGDVFGVEFDRPRTAAAEASVATELTRFPMAALAGGVDAGAMAELVAAASDMAAALSMHLRGFGHGLAEDRVMWFLDWMADRQGADRQGGVIQPPMSRRDIADFLGLAQETLSRTFARLEAQGLLRPEGRGLALRPPPRAGGIPGSSAGRRLTADPPPGKGLRPPLHPRRIFAIGRPLASSSTSLSR